MNNKKLFRLAAISLLTLLSLPCSVYAQSARPEDFGMGTTMIGLLLAGAIIVFAAGFLLTGYDLHWGCFGCLGCLGTIIFSSLMISAGILLLIPAPLFTEDLRPDNPAGAPLKYLLIAVTLLGAAALFRFLGRRKTDE